MSIIAPNSEVTLYRNVMISDREHIVFATEAERDAYFTAHKYKDNVECSYQRIGDPLVLEIPISDMYKFNYISFKNPSFENKIIFARTLNPVYINNEVLAVPYVVDDWTTFMFDVNCEECSVVREHIKEVEKSVIDDNPYSLTVLRDYPFMHTPEPFSPVASLRNKLNYVGTDTYAPIIDFTSNGLWRPQIFMFVSQVIDTQHPDGTYSPPPVWMTGMNFASCVAFYNYEPNSTGLQQLQDKINEYTIEGCVSSILGIYVLPYIYGTAFDSGTETNFRKEITVNIPRTSYSNKKLSQFPYTFLSVTDPMGNVKEYQIERFDNIDGTADPYQVKFSLFFTWNGQPEVVLAPQNYNGFSDGQGNVLPSNKQAYKNANFYEKMVFNQFPQIAYNTDGYLTWLGNTLRGQTLKDTTAAPWAYNDILFTMGQSLETTGALFKGVVGATGQLASGNMIGAGANLASGFVDYGSSLFNQMGRNWEYAKNKDLHRTSTDFQENGMDAKLPSFLKDANRAFVNNDYKSGGSSSTLTAYMLGRIGFYFKVETLLDGVAYKYNNCMNNYGYAVLDSKIPNLFNIMATQSWSSMDNPIFCQMDFGTEHSSVDVTYVQTVDCNLTCKTNKAVPLDSLRRMEALFDGGHRFLKGSTAP